MSRKTFDKHLAELAAFTKIHGHACVPVRSCPLGLWLNNQRYCARNGKLKPERVHALRLLGVDLPDLTAKTPGRTASRLEDLLDAGERFGTLYADPPWQYRNSGTRAAAKRHYGCMSIEDLAALPVARLADDDAHLYLWTTTSHLPHTFDLMRAWGFEYRNQYIWCKPRIGLGNYWRVAHEILLLGIRGDAKRFRIHNWRSWEELPATQHSAKPELVRQRIEQASPGPYLELFGRRVSPGWTVFGNQIGDDLVDRAHLDASTNNPCSKRVSTSQLPNPEGRGL